MKNKEKQDLSNVDDLRNLIDDIIDKLYYRQSTEGIDFGELIDDLEARKTDISRVHAATDGYNDLNNHERSEWKKGIKNIGWDILRTAIIKAVSDGLPIITEKILHLK